MPSQKTRNILTAVTCVVIVLVASVMGYLLTHGNSTPEATATTGIEPLPPAPAPTVALRNVPPRRGPIPPPQVPDDILRAFAGTPMELTTWRFLNGGCEVEQTGSKLHIVGTNSMDGWGHENGVISRDAYPVQDFELNTEFMMPKLSGAGNAMVFVQARESNSRQVNLQYYVQGSSYMMRWWTNSGEAFANTRVPKFGNEATSYHRFRLKYDAAIHESTGWVDDKEVGKLNFELQSNVQIMMGVATDKKGNDIDVTFDHTTLTIGGKIAAPGVIEKMQ